MKVFCITNLKGGVGKTITAVNTAYLLSVMNGRVLLIDNDKQGNSSKFFGVWSDDVLSPSISNVLTERNYDIRRAIQRTKYERLDVLPANMSLLKSNKDILLDCSRPQQSRLQKALKEVCDLYDYVVVDCAPDINMSVINALVASDEVIIPLKIDQFAFDGLDQLREQIEDVREFNPSIRIAGCLVTMFSKNSVNLQGAEALRRSFGLPVFESMIRKTVKVDETTFAGIPLQAYAPKCSAAKDYVSFIEELLR